MGQGRLAIRDMAANDIVAAVSGFGADIGPKWWPNRNSDVMKVKDKVILATGGTGSFGRQFVKTALATSQPRKALYAALSRRMGPSVDRWRLI